MDANSRADELDEVTSGWTDETTPKPSPTSIRTRSAAKAPFKKSSLKKIKVEGKSESVNTKKVYMTPDEEEALLEVLKDLAHEGWKAGQGWKTGVHTKAATKVKALVKGSTITAKNVVNKMHIWGKQYRFLNEFMKRSGVSIDSDTHAIVVDCEDLWNEYAKVNKKYLSFRGKTFPYYDLWSELFGQFRTTGSGARDDVAIGKPSPKSVEEVIETTDDSENSEETQAPPTFQTSNATTRDSNSRGKRKTSETISNVDIRTTAQNTLSKLDIAFTACTSVFGAHVDTEKCKEEKTQTLKLHLLDYPELNVEERLRFIDHMLCHDGHYYYWTTSDTEERDEVIRLFGLGRM